MRLLFIWILQRQKCRVKVKVKQLHLPVIKKRKRNEPLHWSTERDYFIQTIFLLAETFGIKKASRTVNCIDFL